MRIFLTHVPDMLENYYGPRALAEMRKLGEVRLNTSGKVLDAKALAEAAKGCEIIVSDRQTPGPTEFFPLAPDCCAFLRVAVDIRNIDVEAASREGVLVTRATPGFMASVSEMAIGMMIDCARGITDATIAYRRGEEAEPRKGIQLHGSTVGIMGYGAIARHLAPICVALGMTVLVSDPFATVEDKALRHVPLEMLLADSDFVDLPGDRQRADREPDERGEFRAHEEERLFPQSVARQSGRRGSADAGAGQETDRRRRDGCRPRVRPEALARPRAPRRRDRDAAYRRPHARTRSSIRRSIPCGRSPTWWPGASRPRR